MAHAIEHPPLVVGVLNLLHLDHLGLFQHFHCIEAVVVLGLHQVDATEASGAERALQGEVFLRVLALGAALLGDTLGARIVGMMGIACIAGIG